MAGSDKEMKALLDRWGKEIAAEQSRYAKALREFKKTQRSERKTEEIRTLLEQAGLIQPAASEK
ncbi:MAG: hypothetical protein LCH90_17190 [Proteobacteria bacterium]|nr:hypothetical protein [Pseudomonadota bacterium]